MGKKRGKKGGHFHTKKTYKKMYFIFFEKPPNSERQIFFLLITCPLFTFKK
jgi:hypothetical protein